MKIAPKYHRKAALLDALALVLIVVLVGLLGIIEWAAVARADSPDHDVLAYTATHAAIVCQVLDEHDSIAGMVGVAQAIAEDGLTGYQTGQVVALSIANTCPRHMHLIREFLAQDDGRAVA